MFDFACTNAMSQGSEGTVGGGVTVTANDSGTWQSEALLGANDVNDSLSFVTQTKVCKTEGFDVLFKGDTLCS